LTLTQQQYKAENLSNSFILKLILTFAKSKKILPGISKDHVLEHEYRQNKLAKAEASLNPPGF